VVKKTYSYLFCVLRRFIRRFRHPSKLVEEGGYYLTQLESAVHFLLRIKPVYLKNVTDEQFERYVSLLNFRAIFKDSNNTVLIF
jgi:hypothetical protein